MQGWDGVRSRAEESETLLRQKHLHFLTWSCYRRRPLLGPLRARNQFVKILDEVRQRYRFRLVGYVVMPDHVHLLMSDFGKENRLLKIDPV